MGGSIGGILGLGRGRDGTVVHRLKKIEFNLK